MNRLAARWRRPGGRPVAYALPAAVAVALGAWVAVGVVGRSVRWRVMPDCGGPIRRVVCVVNSARQAVLRNADLVSNIVNALPGRTQVMLATSDRRAFVVACQSQAERVRFVELPAGTAVTIWPQDPFVVLQDGRGRSCLLASATFERADDARLAEHLARVLGWRCRKSRWSFEGGNLVVGPRYAFVGADTVQDNVQRTGLDRVAVVRGLEKELGRPVLVLGPVPQPVGHIDMVVTPAGRSEVFVADAGWGARLAEGQLSEQPQAVLRFEQSCQEMFFGDRHIRSLPGPQGRTIKPPRVVGRTAEVIRSSRLIAPVLDGLAGALRKRGLTVRRLPFLYDWPAVSAEEEEVEPPPAEGRPRGQGQDTEGPSARPGYPCLTYNNVLMEMTGEQKTVYLPRYGWPAIDRVAAEAWEQAGWSVHPVEGLAISAMYGGSLRCCVKVLQRQAVR